MPYRVFADPAVRERVRNASESYPDVAQWTARFFRPLVDLNPDVIYVHDAVLLLAGGLAKEELARRGKQVLFITDVHEWWPGVSGTTPERIKSRTDLEEEWVPTADKVLTVSQTLAGWLQERLALTAAPTSVENGAVAAVTPAEGRQTIRTECGLSPETPLLVYAGAVAPARGIDVAIDAVAAIPGAHLVMVAGRRTAEVARVEEHAIAQGISDRFHIVSYVPPESISWYLSSATIGLAPFRRSKSHDSALATKISEYLNARLPLVVSDCEAQAKYVTAHGIGEVFTAEDAEGARLAIERVLQNREGYVARITEDLVQKRTWEYQEQVFVEALKDVALPSVPRVAPTDPGPAALRFSRELIEVHADWLQGETTPGPGSRQFRALFGRDPERQQLALEGLVPVSGDKVAGIEEAEQHKA